MKRPFVPAFLQKLDKKLLLNKPNTWSMRTHLVVYYSFLFMLALSVLSLLTAGDPRSYYSNATRWMGITILACFIGLVIWLIYFLRFNVFKRYGIQKPGEGLKNFGLIFTALFFIILPTYIPTIIESARTNIAYSSDEMMNDINSINKKICQINYNMLQKTWSTDMLQVVPEKSVDGDRMDNRTIWDSARNEYVKADRLLVTEKSLKQKLEQADSSIKLSNSRYIIRTCPRYALLYNDAVERHSNVKRLSSMDLYRTVIKNYSPVNKDALRTELNVLLKKYYFAEFGPSYRRIYDNVDPDNVMDKSPDQELKDFYDLGAADNALSNIAEKKYRWDLRYFGEYFRIIFYITFCLSLLVFIFRHTTRKTFFLTLLTVFVMAIFTGILISFLPFYTGREQITFSILVIYYVLFFLLMLAIFRANTRKAINGIALNLITFFSAFLPLALTGFYYSTLHQNNDSLTTEERDLLFKNEYTHYFIAEIAGVLLFIILLEPLFKRLYRKWYSLPEN